MLHLRALKYKFLRIPAQIIARDCDANDLIGKFHELSFIFDMLIRKANFDYKFQVLM